MSKKLQHLIELIRLKKPIGYMLLFWPCAWGLTIAYDLKGDLSDYFYFLILFFCGAVLMRSAGCVINDIVDRNLDKRVTRTKGRPIASGKITVLQGLIISSILCLVALIVLLQFNKLTVILAIASMPLAFTYPYMKRFTYWPQLYLGITFNYGLILGWTSIQNYLNFIPFILYIGAIFWTLGYDTIYGYQDINDDEIIGVKSTSIKFKNNPKIFIAICYSITILSFILIGNFMEFKMFYYLSLIFPILHLYMYQLKKLETNNELNCLKLFKSNNLFGFIFFLNILVGKLNF